MVVAQPAFAAPTPTFAAVVARPLSVWPFATRTQRLFLLVDPSLPDAGLRAGLLRAMQQAYFRSDGCSQTRAVREAALAVHYVLRHHNRDVLPQDQVSAATAVAAVRGNLAYIALAGDAAVFSWRQGELAGQRGVLRLRRPLGLEQDPRIRLWSTPVEPGDRLVLVCGAVWRPDSARAIEDVLQTSASGEAAEQRLATVLGAVRPAGVLVADPARAARPDRHVVLVSSVERGEDAAESTAACPPSRQPGAGARLPRWRWLSTFVAVVLLAAAAAATLNPAPETPRLSLVHQSQALLAQADETLDPYEAHALAASAAELAQRSAASAPTESAVLVDAANARLNQIDRNAWVAPSMAVRLGPSGGNVVDLAVNGDALYTLDVVEASVRAFNANAHDQQPTPDTLVLRAGAPISGSGHRLASPVAMRYVGDATRAGGSLVVVDQARSVIEVGRDRAVRLRPLVGSGTWREIGALGGGAARLLVLDSAARSVFDYALPDGRAADPPRVVLDGRSAPELDFERAAEIVPQRDRVFLRMDDGSLHRFDAQLGETAVEIRPPDGRRPVLAGMTSDGGDGLYLADPANARILHTTADGVLLRQFRDPALAGVRQIQSSPDGHRIFGLVASGVLAFDVADPAAQ